MPNIKTKWNLELLFKDTPENIEKYEKEVEERTNAFIEKWETREDYLNNPSILKEALLEYSDLLENYDFYAHESFYLGLREDLNQEDADLKARINKLHSKRVELYNRAQFFSLRIAKIDPRVQQEILNSKELSEYKHYLNREFVNAKFLLSESEEKIVNIMGKTSSSNWRQMVSDLLSKEKAEVKNSKGETEELSFSEIISKTSSTDKVERDSAGEQVHKINKKHSEVATYELNSLLEAKTNLDKLRGFEKPESSRHIQDDIETEVVDALAEAVTERFDLAKKYYRIKAKYMGVDKLKYHERNVPVGEVEHKYSLEQGVKLVKESLADLDSEFESIFNSFVDEGRVDFLPGTGKANGAYCAAMNNKAPIFILMNYTDKLNDVLTLAHEVGHGIHYTLGREQNILNFGASLATAEVASTFMEDFVLQKIEKDLNEADRKMLSMTRLMDDISTIFRQVACYNFEKELHKTFREKGFLSTKEIGEIFTKHMASYMGDAVSMDQGSENWWVYWSHIRRPFYVYSYASGLLISKSLQNLVKQDPVNIEKVKTFMKAGESKSPLNIFKDIGLDISQKSFWEAGLKEIEEALEKLD